jgi:hypothetical protein
LGWICRWGFADFDGPGAAKAVETAVRRSISGKLALHFGRRVFIRPCLPAPPAALRIKDGASVGTAAITKTSRREKSDKKPSAKQPLASGSSPADSHRAKPGRSERRRHAAAAAEGDRPAKDAGKREAKRGS